jgi:putative OPT family oligopeptide transporter
MEKFEPYVHADTKLRDFSVKALIVGAVLGVLFGTANAYLGLRVGLTISTSIPLAVIAVAFFRATRRLWGRPVGILENNIAQTTGSASSSLASGVIFTIPALFLWGFSPSIAKIGTLALLGGVLGILFMIPLRRFLIIKEHRNLPYPEGTASAQVLIAAEEGGTKAKNIFLGLSVGAVYKAVLGFLHLIPEKVSIMVPGLTKAVVGLETSPALLGVGFILNYRIAAIMAAGGLLSWVVLIPLIATFGDGFTSPFFPETTKLISEMSAAELWTRYIRYIGAGAVAMAGIITVFKSLPTMYHSLTIGLKELFSRSAAGGKLRTDRDIPMVVVVIGVSLVVLMIAALPHAVGEQASMVMRFVAAICITAFAFLFVTVASRIVGLVGVTSNPTSGMTIVTLLGTSFVFAIAGWTDAMGMATALTCGTVVAVAASISGDISQDLKTGYLIGATPWRQQSSEIVGAIASAFFIAAAVWFLGEAFGFGSQELPAPQAALMKTVIEGVMRANLPWELVFVGAAIAVIAQIIGLRPLPFAVGTYLPLSTLTPLFLGGLIRLIVEWRAAKKHEMHLVERRDQGILLGSGLIAGEGLMGVAIALYAFFYGRPRGLGFHWPEPWGQLVSFGLFLVLAVYLYHKTRIKDT